MPESALLVMSYGSPRDLDDVEAYYTHIRHGRPPPPELLEELKARYRRIGGRSPLAVITRAQAAGIEARLERVRAFVGFKHSPPFIADALQEIATAALPEAIGLVLAPHYSRMSVGDYARRAQQAAEAIGWGGRLRMIESWHLEPGLVAWFAARVRAALERLAAPSRRNAIVVFSAHSLPEAILRTDDPYARQLEATAAAVAEAAGAPRWRVAWQSAGRTGESWLGPDVLDVIAEEAAAGTTGVVVCPCGFVADHLEILYDVDVACAAAARAAGIEFARTESPNDDPSFLDVVAGVVGRELARAA